MTWVVRNRMIILTAWIVGVGSIIGCWGPVGEFQVGFSSDRDSSQELYRMDMDGNNQERLTNNGFLDLGMVVSPTTSQIAFYSDRNDNLDIYVADPDMREVSRLTKSSGSDVDPDWSPDGAKIVFTSSRDGNLEIYSMNSNGSNQIRLTNSPENDSDPAWSPDGSLIAYSRNGDIYTMSDDGSGSTRLTSTSTPEIDPDWSPDGRISFTAMRDRDFDIYIIESNGTGEINITNDPYVPQTLATWSPDGRKIAYQAFVEGSWEVFVMNPDGDENRRLTSGLGHNIMPAWFWNTNR